MHYVSILDRILFLPLLVFGIEILVGGWEKSSFHKMLSRPDGSQRTDMFFFLAYGTGVFSTVVTICSFGLSYFIGRATHQGIQYLTGLNVHINTGSNIANFAIYYFSYSFLEYWNHRLFHIGLLWNFHRIHHSATSLNPLVQHRNHPVQHALEPLLLAWPLGLVSIPLTAIIVLASANQFYQLLVHTDIPWDWGWFGRWVFISPVAHRIHHSAAPEHYGKNLSVLTIWDRLFGTWYDGKQPVIRLGVDSDLYNKKGIISDCLHDYREFFRSLRPAKPDSRYS